MSAAARLALALSLALLAACAARRPSGDAPEGAQDAESPAKAAPQDEPEKEPEKEPAEEPEDDDSRGLLWGILMYVPNRVLDVFDVARFGVEVGPGIGIDAGVTEFVRLGAMTRTSFGLGYQTLRHLPTKGSAEAYAGVGPIDLGGEAGMHWYRNLWDVRVELHLLLVGGHVAVNPAEIADAVLGIVTIDVMDDDG